MARRNERRAERLLRQGLDGRRCRGAVVASALSLAAVSLTLVCLGGGVVMAVFGRHSPLLVGLGVILAVSAGAVRPRPPRLGPDVRVVDFERTPHFGGLLTEIAHAVGTQVPGLVAFDLEPNASVGNVGYLGRPMLRVGAPLWTILDGQERVGLLAHELAHVANGDPRRGRIMALGTETLVRWWVALVPPPTARPDGPARWLADTLFAGLRLAVRLWVRAIDRFQMPAVQLAELRSDRTAATVAGWRGYTRLLERLASTDRLDHAVDLATARRDGTDFYASILDSMRSLPPQEKERLRRIVAREAYGPDLSHPPVRLRLRAVGDMQAEQGSVTPSAGRWAGIDGELAPLLAELAQRRRDDHHAKRDPYAGIRRRRVASASDRADRVS